MAKVSFNLLEKGVYTMIRRFLGWLGDKLKEGMIELVPGSDLVVQGSDEGPLPRNRGVLSLTNRIVRMCFVPHGDEFV